MSLALLPLGTLDAFGYTGTFATFGFLVVYLLICVAVPVDQYRAGLLKARHVFFGVAGTVLMAFVMVGSIYPAPPYPGNLIPYLFALYLVLGLLWFGNLRIRSPGALVAIAHDLEF